MTDSEDPKFDPENPSLLDVVRFPTRTKKDWWKPWVFVIVAVTVMVGLGVVLKLVVN